MGLSRSGPVHIVVDHAPYPGILLADACGKCFDRQGSDHAHDQGLEEQGEPAARTGPGHGNQPDAALLAFDAGHFGRQPCFMLEEVQMTPGPCPQCRGL